MTQHGSIPTAESFFGTSSWRVLKDQGKSFYDLGNFDAALKSFTAATQQQDCPTAEKQILLSNIVACRLQLGGGRAQAEAAVEAAKQCVALNECWAKGHVRLATAYIALGGHSNDACNALQTALRLDPGNPTARDLLVRELRRDAHPTPSTASAPPAHQDDRTYPTDGRRRPAMAYGLDEHHNDDEGGSNNIRGWTERARTYWRWAYAWYQDQSEDKKTVLKVVVVLLCLYVALGGRFGWEQGPRQRLGNYDSGNVYDRYHQSSGGGNSYRQHSYEPPERKAYQDGASASYYGGEDSYSSSRRGNRGRTSSSFHFPNLLDGSLQSMALLAGIAYVAHRNGIHPMQALFFLNMLGGRGVRRRGMMHGGGGFGRPRYGGGGYYGRPRW